MLNKYVIYRHFKGGLYLPLMQAKSAVDDKLCAVYMALKYMPLENGEQSICSRPYKGDDGFFEKMPEGREYYANKEMRMEEVAYENMYIEDKESGVDYPIDDLIITGSTLTISIFTDDGSELNFYIHLNSEKSWAKYEIKEIK